MKSKRIYFKHRHLGDLFLRIDEEDYSDFCDKKIYLKTWVSRDERPLASIKEEGVLSLKHIARLILLKHNILNPENNVYYKNGNSLDLRKKNLLVGKRYV